jgi:hypothetical protein
MRYWYLLCSLKRPQARRYVVDRVKNICAVIPASAFIAYSNSDVFEYYEAVLVFECFTLHILRSDRSFAKLTLVSVHACSFLRVFVLVSDETRHSYTPRLGQAASMQLDPLQLVQRLSSQIAFTATWAYDHRHVLDHEQVGPLAVRPRHVLCLSLSAATDIASNGLCFLVIRHKLGRVFDSPRLHSTRFVNFSRRRRGR